MRILHFADLHIGVENYGRTDPETGLSTRLLDFLSTLDELVEFALTQDVDLVLLAGDAYKGRDPSQTHQRELAKRLARLSSAGVPVYLLAGNHDLPYAIGRATAVEIFHTLQVPNLYVGDTLRTDVVPTRKGPLQVLALPWPNRGKLLTRDESKGLTIEQVRTEIEERLTDFVARQVERMDPDVPAVLAGHVTISGAVTGSERSMMLGRDHALFPSAVHKPQLDYVALGHIHKHQVLREDPMVVYSGSLQRVDFSEEEDTKGFCVIDLDPTAPQGRRLVDFRFQSVSARPFLTVDVKVPPGDRDPTRTVIGDIMRRRVADSIVRLRVSLPAGLEVQVREGEIQEALLGAHYVAAISMEVEQERRTRVAPDLAEGLSPMGALRLYLESRDVEQERLKKLLDYAEELLPAESPEDI